LTQKNKKLKIRTSNFFTWTSEWQISKGQAYEKS